jgi:hypothetical protein
MFASFTNAPTIELNRIELCYDFWIPVPSRSGSSARWLTPTELIIKSQSYSASSLCFEWGWPVLLNQRYQHKVYFRIVSQTDTMLLVVQESSGRLIQFWRSPNFIGSEAYPPRPLSDQQGGMFMELYPHGATTPPLNHTTPTSPRQLFRNDLPRPTPLWQPSIISAATSSVCAGQPSYGRIQSAEPHQRRDEYPHGDHQELQTSVLSPATMR